MWAGMAKTGRCVWRYIGVAIVLTVLFYVLQLAALIVRFMEVPNYVNVHAWYTNIIRIFESTPSLKDSLMIAKDEWILEVGYMNYDFGNGISEWSLFVAPANAMVVLVVSIILVANFRFMRLMRKARVCSPKKVTAASFLGGLGAAFFSLTSITMSWVVCCSTPTWVVGLAILGLGVSTSLWLEPIGFWLNALGVAMLSVLLVIQYRFLRKNTTYELSKV